MYATRTYFFLMGLAIWHFFTPFDQGVKFFSPLNAFPQFDDFMFHDAQ